MELLVRAGCDTAMLGPVSGDHAPESTGEDLAIDGGHAAVLQRLALCVARLLHRPHKAQLHSFVGIQSATNPSIVTMHTPCGPHYYMCIKN